MGTAFALRSGMSDAMFSDVQIGPDSATNGFIIDLINLDEDVCERLGIANLGPNGIPDASDCENGVLTINYSR